MSTGPSSPNGGERYARKDRLPVNWEWHGNLGEDPQVRIELYRSGQLAATIASSAHNSGWCGWQIPDNLALGTGYSVRIASLSSSAYDVSDGTFEIVDRVVLPTVITLTSIDQIHKIGRDAGYPHNWRYQLGNDISASSTSSWDGGKGFKPIGDGYSNYFRGALDGRGYKITGLTINRPTEPLVGLFSVIMDSASVTNLRLEGAEVFGKGHGPGDDGGVGAIVGQNAGKVVNCHVILEDLRGKGGSRIGGLAGENTGTGQILNCSVQTTSEDLRAEGTSPKSVGGLVGENWGLVAWCHAICRLDADKSGTTSGRGVGGLVGTNEGPGIVKECYVSSTWVDGTNYVGGIVGQNTLGGRLSDCYFLGGPVDGDTQVGGLVGYNEGGIVERSYVAGSVDGNYQEGALVGQNSSSVVDCFWSTDHSGLPGIGAQQGTFSGCSGKTSAQLKARSTFEARLWDFAGTWVIQEGTNYPELRGIGSVLATPTGLTASSGLSDGVHVAWSGQTFTAGNQSLNAYYRVFRSDSADGTKTPVGQWISSPSFVDTTAIPDLTYYYWVQSSATSGGGRASELSSAATGSRAMPPLETSTDISASNSLPNRVVITWEPVSLAGAYRVYRSTSIGGTKAPISAWLTERSYADESATSGVTFYYWVVAAIDASGARASSFGGPAPGVAITPDYTPPSIDLSVTPTDAGEGEQIEFTVAVDDNKSVGRIVLHWNDGVDRSHEWSNLASAQVQEHHTIAGLPANQLLSFWAEAWDSSGNRGEGERRSVTIVPESVSVPNTPDGSLYLPQQQNGQYSAQGAETSLGSAVQYQFDWGDGTQSSGWGNGNGEHSWLNDGYYQVKVRARSQVNTNRVSAWSSSLLVTVDSEAPIVSIATDGGNGPGVGFETNTPTLVLEGLCYEPGVASGVVMVDAGMGNANEGTRTLWRYTLALQPGVNMFQVVAADACGNVSVPAAITVDYVPIWYRDDDADGFGTDSDFVIQMNPPGNNYVLQGGDCNDQDSDIYPGAPEPCDGTDHNCDGQIAQLRTWHPDADGDGFGDDNTPGVDQCEQPQAYVLDNTDCDDGNNAIHPGATDTPNNGIDEDCNGSDATSGGGGGGGGGGTTDADNDGVADSQDACPGTPAGAAVDAQGCAASQRDTDADGVTDDKDNCPNTPAGEAVNANGCSQSQLDDDGDGVANSGDTCPNTASGTTVDADGCPVVIVTPPDSGQPTPDPDDGQEIPDGDGDDNGQTTRPPPFSFCGWGIVEAMMVSLLGLTLMRVQRRR